MSFQVQCETLRTHAQLWDGHASDAADARTTIDPAIGDGDAFGWLAGLNQVADHYNTWSAAMGVALDDAKKCCTYLTAALRSTANDYDDSDQTVATDMATLDQMI
ncbi:MAG TPA: hypothetical protein VNS55_00360 [Nocardioides sp.]|nr:hypothetical protein [Nocardioides sp.]